MKDREKNEKTRMEKNPYVRELLNVETDERVKRIYERYHTGKTIIIDDLKYLLVKNPEAFEKMARSFIQINRGKEFNFESIDLGNRDYEKKNIDSIMEEGNNIDYKTNEGSLVKTVDNISSIMASVRSVIENMSDEELREISKNVYEPLELIKRIAILKELEDNTSEEKGMHNFENEKDFDISV